ncbi:MAG: hypothetical protein HQL30_05165 [Candidatus Omnitrophica bacterium]|nr:hypothetical protein [Candidatus Omnitrophota bacterium]
MEVKESILNGLKLKKLTGPAFRGAIAGFYSALSDAGKRRVNREIALSVIKTCTVSERENRARPVDASNVKVLAVNHAGPLDVTIEWMTSPDKTLELSGCRIDPGGDQINVSKVFSHFDEKIALVALAGKKGDIITRAWENGFLNPNIVTSLIRSGDEGTPAAIYNVIDGETLPGMFGFEEEPRTEILEDIDTEVLSSLAIMSKDGSDNIWMVLSAGGPIRYDRKLACYASLVKRVKKEYPGRVKLLIDFKFMSRTEEAMSVLEIPRDKPQDIIKPNLEEFLEIIVSSGLAGSGLPPRNAVTEKDISSYAIKLRDKYNLLGVLVSMDRSGLMLVMSDRIIREKGIKIEQVSPTGAGDALKAGFLYALSNGRSFEEAVHTGNLFGAATASMEGTQTVTPESLSATEALARAQYTRPVIEFRTPENR